METHTGPTSLYWVAYGIFFATGALLTIAVAKTLFHFSF